MPDINVNQLAEAINNKADRDLHNINNTGKSLVSGQAMPSASYIDLTLGASGATYTAPANGWFCFYRNSNSPAGYSALLNVTNGFITETRNSVSGAANGIWIPARQNDVVRLHYDGGGTVTVWRFYRAEGEAESL